MTDAVGVVSYGSGEPSPSRVYHNEHDTHDGEKERGGHNGNVGLVCVGEGGGRGEEYILHEKR